jgi:hypothetical protein
LFQGIQIAQEVGTLKFMIGFRALQIYFFAENDVKCQGGTILFGLTGTMFINKCKICSLKNYKWI